MYGCESWTIKKAECWRIDAFEVWCWRRLLRVPWTARRSSQSILKEISPERSLEGLMLKLKLQYFGHLMGRTDSLEKTLMLGKIGGRRRRGRQRMRWLDGITDLMDVRASSRSGWWTGRPGMLQSMGVKRWLSDWTELFIIPYAMNKNNEILKTESNKTQISQNGECGGGLISNFILLEKSHLKILRTTPGREEVI